MGFWDWLFPGTSNVTGMSGSWRGTEPKYTPSPRFYPGRSQETTRTVSPTPVAMAPRVSADTAEARFRTYHGGEPLNLPVVDERVPELDFTLPGWAGDWNAGFYGYEPANLRPRAESEADMIIKEQLAAIAENRAATEREYAAVLDELQRGRGEQVASEKMRTEELEKQTERRLAARGFDTGGAYRWNRGRFEEAALGRMSSIENIYNKGYADALRERQGRRNVLGSEAQRIRGSREGLINQLLRGLEEAEFSRYISTLPYAMEGTRYPQEQRYRVYRDEMADLLASQGLDIDFARAQNQGGGGTQEDFIGAFMAYLLDQGIDPSQLKLR